MDIFIGVVLLVGGLAFAFAGLRFWFILLPVLGFFAGLSAGVALMYWIFDEGLFATATGLIIGFFIGLVFGALSYLFWYVGALLGAGFVGAAAGAGLMEAFGVDSGIVIFSAAAILCVAFIIAAIVLWLPIYIVIVNTALAGATWAIAGVMLVFNVVDRADLGYGSVSAAIDESWFWALAWIALGVLGIVAQIGSLRDITLPEDRWTRVEPIGQQQPAY